MSNKPLPGRRLVAVALSIVAGGIGVGLVVAGVNRLEQGPLDPASPRDQNGYHLRTVSLVESEPSAFYIRARTIFPFLPVQPAIPRALVFTDDTQPANTTNTDFDAWAETPNGSRFSLNLGFTLHGNGIFENHLRLPEGFPDTVSWVHLVVKDRHKPRIARWRLHGLPRAWHAIVPPVQTKSSDTVLGIPLEARVWWDSNGVYSPVGRFGNSGTTPLVCEVRRTPVIALQKRITRHPWSLEIKDVLTEWEAPSRQHSLNNTMGGTYTTAHDEQYAATGIGDAFLGEIRYAKIRGNLCEYEPLRESVTFADLPVHQRNGIW